MRRWVIHGVIVVVVRRVRTSRTIGGIWTVGGIQLVGVGMTLVAAVIVICVVGMIWWTTILLSTVVWTTEDLIRKSNVLHAWRIVWRLRVWREPLTFARREGIRGAMLR